MTIKISTLFTKIIFLSFLFLFLFAPLAQAGQKVERFHFPNIRDDFCGVFINFQYCKCAFHNDYCEEVGLSVSSANTYVWDEYREWVRKSINTMGRTCELQGGIWKTQNRSCTTCTDPHTNVDGKCVKGDNDAERNEETTEDVKLPEGPFNNDCSTNSDFENDWQKYSDIDARLETGQRSYEAEQYASTIENIVELRGLAFDLKAMMEIDRVKRVQMREIRSALIQNQKVNLLKAFWRLSYITYTTIKSGKGSADSLAEAVSADNVIKGVAQGIKFIQSNTPGDSALAVDTSDLKGKVRSVGINAALEAVDTLGDPVKIVTKIVDDSVKATYPSADITPEEIEILRNQYLRHHDLDVRIQESYEINAERRETLMMIEKQILEFQAQAEIWKQKEKARVRDSLENSCKEQMKQK